MKKILFVLGILVLANLQYSLFFTNNNISDFLYLKTQNNNLLEKISKDRTKARNELLKSLNPIIENYMQEKKIRLVFDKKNIILADQKLDISKEIMEVLNTKLKSIKLN